MNTQSMHDPFVKLAYLYPTEKKKADFNELVKKILIGLTLVGDEKDEATKDLIYNQISSDKKAAMAIVKENAPSEIRGCEEIGSMFWRDEDDSYHMEYIYGTPRFAKLMESIHEETSKTLKAQGIKYETEEEFQDVCRRNVATARNAVQTAIVQKFLLSGLMSEIVNATAEVGELSGTPIQSDILIQEVMKLVEKYIPAEARILAANRKMETVYRKFL